MSLARSFLSGPHGMIFIHASCEQPLMNSPIRKLSFVILSETEESMYALLLDPSSLAGKLCQDDSPSMTMQSRAPCHTERNQP